MRNGQLCLVKANTLLFKGDNSNFRVRVYRVGATARDIDYLAEGTAAILIEYVPNSQCKILANEKLYYIAASSLKELEPEE